MARWYSTPESAKNREVTVLAVTETVLATSFTLWLAVSIYGNWTHIAIAACIAPLLLLRTEASNTLNMTWAKLWNEAELIRKSPLGWLIRFTKRLNSSKFGKIVMLYVLFPIGFVFLRVLAIMVTTLRHPLRSITNIPTNWQRITLCADFAHSPEVIPGIETERNLDPFLVVFRFSTVTKILFPIQRVRIYRFPYYFLISPIWLGLFIPAILYRFSLKSTAIVWLPLLWIIPKANPKETLATRLRLIHKSSWGRFVTLMSLFVLICFLAKLALYSGVTEVVDVWEGRPFASEFESFIAPYSVPIWQVSSAVNSLLAIALYLFASHQLILLDAGEKVAEKALGVDYTLRTASVIRTSLSLYTSLCLGYLVLHQAWLTNWPPLGDKLFPWQ